MSKDPIPKSKNESIEIPVAELRWSLASFGAFVAAWAFLIGYFLSGQELIFLVIVVSFLMLRMLATWRLRCLENLRTPDPKRQTGSLFQRLALLALMFPFLLALFIIIGVVVALVRGTDVLNAVARGSLTAALMTFGISFLIWAGRIFTLVFGPKVPKSTNS